MQLKRIPCDAPLLNRPYIYIGFLLARILFLSRERRAATKLRVFPKSLPRRSGGKAKGKPRKTKENQGEPEVIEDTGGSTQRVGSVC